MEMPGLECDAARAHQFGSRNEDLVIGTTKRAQRAQTWSAQLSLLISMYYEAGGQQRNGLR